MARRTPQFERTVENVERDHRAAEMRARGMTYEQIAQAMGIKSRQGAWEMVHRALSEVPKESTERLLALELAKLDHMERQVHAVLARKHLQIAASGRVVLFNGEPVEDDEVAMKAVDRLLKISQRRARLLGLEAPTRVNLGVNEEQVELVLGALSAALALVPVKYREPARLSLITSLRAVEA